MTMIATMPAVTLVPMTMPDAIESTWRAIRLEHRELPPVSVQIVSGRGSGHGEADWNADRPVLKVSSTTVADGPEAILGWLLHQAAHGLLAASGGRTGGNEGRYHSDSFREAAARLGLQVAHVSQGLGWARTWPGEDLLAEYAEHLDRLREAMATWQQPPAGHRSPRPARCQCTPPRSIWLQRKDAAEDLQERPIVCSVCGKPFTALSAPVRASA